MAEAYGLSDSLAGLRVPNPSLSLSPPLCKPYISMCVWVWLTFLPSLASLDFWTKLAPAFPAPHCSSWSFLASLLLGSLSGCDGLLCVRAYACVRGGRGSVCVHMRVYGGGGAVSAWVLCGVRKPWQGPSGCFSGIMLRDLGSLGVWMPLVSWVLCTICLPWGLWVF